MSAQASRPSFLAFAFDYADSPTWADLPFLREGIQQLTAAWSPSLRRHGKRLTGSSSPREVMDELEDMLFTELRDDDAVLVYIGGHGVREGNSHYVVCASAEQGRLTARTALTAQGLAEAIAKARPRQIAVVIDACYSGAGAAQVAAIVDEFDVHARREDMALSIISSAQPLDRALDGAFVEALLEVLSDPEPTLWEADADLIAPRQVALALHLRHGPAVDSRERRFVDPLLPNLGPRTALTSVETARQLACEHFRRAASSLETGETGWFFVGRTAALTAIVAWLREPSNGMFVVTGVPGSGKSALLGCVALLADPVEREWVARTATVDAAAATTPPLGSVTVALHARDKQLDALVRELAAALALDTAGRDELLAAVSERSGPTTVLVDALDEAVPDDVPAIAELLRDLADLPRVKVLVGTRPDRARTSDRSARARFGPILQALAPERIWDLSADDRRHAVADVAAYVQARLDAALPGSPDRGDAAAVRRVAEEVARRADGVFLYARLMTQVLLASPPLSSEPGWEEQLPSAGVGSLLGEVVDADMRRVPLAMRDRVRHMLMALAWAEGEGLPRYRVWPAVASAICRCACSDEDATATLRFATWYLLESREAGKLVYRLNHEELVRHFREESRRGV